jgi:hypothetical protein
VKLKFNKYEKKKLIQHFKDLFEFENINEFDSLNDYVMRVRNNFYNQLGIQNYEIPYNQLEGGLKQKNIESLLRIEEKLNDKGKSILEINFSPKINEVFGNERVSLFKLYDNSTKKIIKYKIENKKIILENGLKYDNLENLVKLSPYCFQ